MTLMTRTNGVCLGIFFLLTGAACSSGDGNASAGSPRTAVSLESTTADAGCFDVSKYLLRLRELPDDLSVLAVSTKIDFSSKKAIRDNFRKLVSYGTFSFEDVPLRELLEGELESVRQENCDSLAFASADGGELTYKIVESGPDFVSAEAEDGRRLRYRWLSERSFEIRQTYSAYDVPCRDHTPISVDHTKVLDWNGESKETISQDSALWIDPSYLKTVAHVTGLEASTLYVAQNVSATAGTVVPVGTLDVNQLRLLAQQDLRPEILACATGGTGEAPDRVTPIPELPPELTPTPPTEEPEGNPAAPEEPGLTPPGEGESESTTN